MEWDIELFNSYIPIDVEGIWFLCLPCFAHIFVQFPHFNIPYNQYHKETLWSKTKKSDRIIGVASIDLPL